MEKIERGCNEFQEGYILALKGDLSVSGIFRGGEEEQHLRETNICYSVKSGPYLSSPSWSNEGHQLG